MEKERDNIKMKIHDVILSQTRLVLSFVNIVAGKFCLGLVHCVCRKGEVSNQNSSCLLISHILTQCHILHLIGIQLDEVTKNNVCTYCLRITMIIIRI